MASVWFERSSFETLLCTISFLLSSFLLSNYLTISDTFWIMLSLGPSKLAFLVVLVAHFHRATAFLASSPGDRRISTVVTTAVSIDSQFADDGSDETQSNRHIEFAGLEPIPESSARQARVEEDERNKRKSPNSQKSAAPRRVSRLFFMLPRAYAKRSIGERRARPRGWSWGGWVGAPGGFGVLFGLPIWRKF